MMEGELFGGLRIGVQLYHGPSVTSMKEQHSSVEGGEVVPRTPETFGRPQTLARLDQLGLQLRWQRLSALSPR
jgi:hypothetical protein